MCIQWGRSVNILVISCITPVKNESLNKAKLMGNGEARYLEVGITWKVQGSVHA